MPETQLKTQVPPDSLADFAVSVLEHQKAEDIRCLDVTHLTSITDSMIVASGRSDRHVRALADALIERFGEAGRKATGIEGQQGGEWVLLDFGDVVIHLMLRRTREFYDIEKLWDIARGRGGSAES